MKPICYKCHCFFRPAKNGYYFTEGMQRETSRYLGSAPRGRRDPSRWKPYKVWCGDLWQCPECNTKIIIGCGLEPLTEHYKPEFGAIQKRLGADQFQVNDC